MEKPLKEFLAESPMQNVFFQLNVANGKFENKIPRILKKRLENCGIIPEELFHGIREESLNKFLKDL